MNEPRFGHTATLLSDGKVLVTGGTSGAYTSLAPLKTAELYDPANGTWTSIAAMAGTRFGHTATLLPNGKVLVVGGLDSFTLATGLTAANTAELYDPSADNWSSAGTLVTGRFIHTASLLSNGQVLVAGGAGSNSQIAITPMASAELYDPGTNQWVATTALKDARISHTATVLKNGQVLVVGGSGTSAILASAELYDPSGKSWADADPLKDARMTHIAALLNNGQVLVAGGANEAGYLESAELYSSAGSVTQTGGSSGGASDKTTQSIQFTTPLPPNPIVGGTYAPTAIASSKLLVTITIDTNSTSICTINETASVVTFTAAGVCVVDANQAGDATYAQAPQAQQKIAVGDSGGGSSSSSGGGGTGMAAQTITFTSDMPTSAVVGDTYTPAATASSGLPVTFSIDITSTKGACSIDAATSVVTLEGTGYCIINADQAGDDTYTSAQKQMPITVN
jgi:N-acetylneuraminic acid mutarotase